MLNPHFGNDVVEGRDAGLGNADNDTEGLLNTVGGYPGVFVEAVKREVVVRALEKRAEEVRRVGRTGQGIEECFSLHEALVCCLTSGISGERSESAACRG